MSRSRQLNRHWRNGVSAAAAAVACVLCLTSTSVTLAEVLELAPGTKLQIDVVQWNTVKGAYEKWEAVGGVFVVSGDGTILLPILGTIDVSAQSETQIATLVAAAMKEKIGLISAPDVTVGIVEYPPVYIVGAVTTPGVYQFRPGLTVLQALAQGGGQYRASAGQSGQDEITLSGELAALTADRLRLTGRIARLEAEMAGEKEIHFPPELATNAESTLVSEIRALEQMVFAARLGEMSRQFTNSAELQILYDKEIAALQTKIVESDSLIAAMQEQLSGVEQLVKRGISTVSRQTEIQQTVATMRVGRLDEDIELMRVRQSVSQAKRQEVDLRDDRLTEIAVELRDSRADLDRLRLREETLRRILLANGLNDASSGEGHQPTLSFTIVRQDNGKALHLPASEFTILVPGDVLKVELEGAGRNAGTAASALSSVWEETSQGVRLALGR